MKQKGTLRLIAGLQALAAVTGMLAAGIISVGAEEKAMTAAKTVWSFRDLLEADTSFAVEGIYTENSGNYTETVVGVRSVASGSNAGSWAKYDIKTVFDTAPVREGDTIRLSVRLWKDDGYNGRQAFGMTLLYYPNAFTDPYSDFRKPIGSMLFTTQKTYESYKTEVDPVYGFSYKVVSLDHTVTSDEVAFLNSKGITPMIGHSFSRNYNVSPLSLFGYAVYNVTQNVCYTNLNGAGFVEAGGSGTVNEIITVKKYDTAYAVGSTVKAGRDAVFPTLSSEARGTGQYRYTFNVTGMAGKSYRLKAYAVTDSGNTVQVGEQTFIASGEEETRALFFNLREEYAALCFGMETGEAALQVKSVSYEGRVGDCGEEDAFERIRLPALRVMTLIGNLPEKIKLSDAGAVAEAANAYRALNSEQRAEVMNADRLENSEIRAEVLRKNAEAVSAVTEKISGINADDPDRAYTVAVRNAYNSLTAVQKKAVSTADYMKLKNAEKKLASENAGGESTEPGNEETADSAEQKPGKKAKITPAKFIALGAVFFALIAVGFTAAVKIKRDKQS